MHYIKITAAGIAFGAAVALAIPACSSPDPCDDCVRRCLDSTPSLPPAECVRICESGEVCP